MSCLFKYDSIVIGAGGAGSSAAIELHKLGLNVLVLAKKERTISKTYNAQGGIQASVGKEDSIENHYRDTLEAGNHKGNPKVVRVLTERAPETIKWLESIGVEFDKEEGQYKLSNAGGISNARILSCKGSAGEGIAKPLWRHVDQLGILTKENVGVLDIHKDENTFYVTVVEDEKKYCMCSNSLVLATGGVISEEKKIGLSDHENSIPDGIELAKRIGAKIVNSELMQFHPTGVIYPKVLRRIRLPETMRGAGAILLNKNNEEFVNHLDTRSKVTEAIVQEIKKGNGFETKDGYLGIKMCTSLIDKENGAGYIKENYQKIYNEFLVEGIDLSKEDVLVYPIVHYSLGGVEIDEKAQTSVPGLFAAGETTWGVHGEDRLMGNSLLDIFVFGRIAGRSAAAYLNKNFRKNG